MKKVLLLVCFGVIFFTLPLHASIISTEVAVGMKIEYGESPRTLDSQSSATGLTFATTGTVTGAVTGATAYSTLNFNSLTNEEANLSFDLGYNGNGYAGAGYMGASTDNFGAISYHADINSVLDISWAFDYSGVNPFGLQVINIQDETVLNILLGDHGVIGHHEGSDIYNLLAGNDYEISTIFYPNVHGSIGGINGQLSGNIGFDFNGAPVPEPATMLLFGLGLLGLAGVSRKK